jgi:hypothetical protein
MTLKDTSTRYSVVPLDVRRLPGWEKAAKESKLAEIAVCGDVMPFGRFPGRRQLQGMFA